MTPNYDKNVSYGEGSSVYATAGGENVYLGGEVVISAPYGYAFELPNLTPDEAREIAGALVEAAAVAERIV